jgi:outer membrane lipoprotein LolB
LKRIIFVLGIFLGLAGCTTIAPEAPPSTVSWETRQTALSRIQGWQLNGKIAVQTSRDSGSATVDWLQRNGSYTVSLLGPLGTSGLKLSGHPGSVTLETSDGKRFTASNPEELLAKQWGFNLPVSYLRYWIRGLPVPGIPSSDHFDPSHRLTDLSQQGWQVQYLSYTRSNNIDLPSKMFISSPTLKVKIIIYSWNV